MVKKWKRIDNRCVFCKKEVAKIKLEDGKVEILEDHLMGTFLKTKGKAELRMICRNCQKHYKNKLDF